MSITYETILQYKNTNISLLTDQPFFLYMDPRVKICNMLQFVFEHMPHVTYSEKNNT